EVYAFDVSYNKIENIKEEVAIAVQMDSTDKKALLAQKIAEMDAAIIAIGENFEATVLTALNLKDLKIPRVIVRASGENQIRILRSLGIDEILEPEGEIASIVAERLINPSITAFLQLPDNYEIAEIKAPKRIVNRTLADIQLIEKYSLTLITLKRIFEEEVNGEVTKEEHILGVLKEETVVYDTDTLVVFGTLDNVKKFIEINV
ncbi:MAG: TrkA family potassium uptake protein, partial [Flavobacteriales bacterium]|nr:TrkA family potassium uptake protein [Flavobacteriales bacterium]